jgi:hypothetical protein
LTKDKVRETNNLHSANVARIDVRKNQLAVWVRPPVADATMDVRQDCERDPLPSGDNENGRLLVIP